MLPLPLLLLLTVLETTWARRAAALSPPAVPDGVELPPSRWFTQTLDHFQPTDERVWPQRYLVNDSFYQTGGPAFLMISGEFPARAEWMVAGQWIEYARQYNALCFQLEHRFYGGSFPTQDMSLENLRYLSSEQALADLATFTDGMTELHQLPEGTRWVAFGGSYPGTLAAWYRLKYPHMVHAAVSSSAPLLAQTDFPECFQVVTDSIRAKSGDECNSNIQTAFSDVEELLQDEAGWATISEKFSLCSPLNGSVELDVSNLFSILADRFEEVVQHNEDNRDFLGAKDSNITISMLCDVMNSGNGSALDRLGAVNQIAMSASGFPCTNHRYSDMISQMQSVIYTSPFNFMRQWIYQTCTEFGWYQTSDSEDLPFGNHIPLSFWVQVCMDVYGPEFNQAFIDASVKATNVKYGGLNLPAKRVVLVHGGVDPWHALGITQSEDPDRPAIFINGSAHCANMYPSRPEDPAELVAAREKIGELIGQWLQD